MLLDDIKKGDLAIFANGDQAFVEDADRYADRLYIIFDRGVLGNCNKSKAWNYLYNGEYVGGGTDIVKVVRND